MRSSLPRRLLLGAALAAPLTGAAWADSGGEGQTYASDPDTNAARDVLSSRNREDIHPGRPLELIGVANTEAGNDMLAGLRAARRGSYEPVKVDEDEAYRRRLAMFESGLTFDRAPTHARDARREVVPARDDSGEGEETQKREPYDTTWIGLLLAAASTVAIFVTRGR